MYLSVKFSIPVIACEINADIKVSSIHRRFPDPVPEDKQKKNCPLPAGKRRWYIPRVGWRWNDIRI